MSCRIEWRVDFCVDQQSTRHSTRQNKSKEPYKRDYILQKRLIISKEGSFREPSFEITIGYSQMAFELIRSRLATQHASTSQHCSHCSTKLLQWFWEFLVSIVAILYYSADFFGNWLFNMCYMCHCTVLTLLEMANSRLFNMFENWPFPKESALYSGTYSTYWITHCTVQCWLFWKWPILKREHCGYSICAICAYMCTYSCGYSICEHMCLYVLYAPICAHIE